MADTTDGGPLFISGRWRRLGGFLVDQFVLSFAVSLATWALIRLIAGDDEDGGARQLAFVLAWMIAVGVVYVVPVARTGRTVGKVLLSMRVVAAGTGRRPSWAASGIRAAVPSIPLLLPVVVRQTDPSESVAASVWIVCSLVWLTVYAAALRSPEVRGLHDRAAGTIVVDERPRHRLT